MILPSVDFLAELVLNHNLTVFDLGVDAASAVALGVAKRNSTPELALSAPLDAIRWLKEWLALFAFYTTVDAEHVIFFDDWRGLADVQNT